MKAVRAPVAGRDAGPARAGSTAVPAVNRRIAARFDEVAALLEQQGANPFRIGAWQRAAAMLRSLEQPVDEIIEREGLSGLTALPTVGDTLARAVRDLVTTGRLPMLDRLRGEVDPEALLRTVPGIGRGLARRLHEELGVATLEELEAAAHDGRLERLPGFGGKRLAGIREALGARLDRARLGRGAAGTVPDVGELLDVDREYRDKSARGELPRIAPRRFNPSHDAWQPKQHTTRGDRHYTALYSNTARAHQLGRTHDWVVLYCDGDRGESPFTVVTGTHGALEGRRLVRGRETESAEAAGASDAS